MYVKLEHMPGCVLILNIIILHDYWECYIWILTSFQNFDLSPSDGDSRSDSGVDSEQKEMDKSWYLS